MKNISFLMLIVLFLTSCTSVHIDDNSVKEMFPSHIPSNICYLRTTRSLKILGFQRGYNSTGTLIQGQYLITAAHNLYDSPRSNLIKVQAVCKSNDGNIITSIVSRDEIKSTRKDNHYDRTFSTDYAFLKLNSPIPVSDSISLSKSISINNIKTIEVAGYPGRKLKYGQGDVIHPIQNDSTFYYDVDTAKGMSGGPVWAGETLIGIHVSSGQRARLVDEGLINDFENWKSNLNTTKSLINP